MLQNAYGDQCLGRIQCYDWFKRFKIGRESVDDKKSSSGKIKRQSPVNGFFFFFDNLGVIHHEFLPAGQTVNRWYYPEVLKRLREKVRKKWPEMWKKTHSFSNTTMLRHTLPC